MNDDGQTIVQIMGQVRTLFRETATLLKTADGLLADTGWVIRTNQCTSVSAVPDNPALWFPYYAFRIYKHREGRFPHILPFVSVIFCDYEGETHVTEALLSAGWHDFGQGKEFAGSLASEFFNATTWHLYMPERLDRGEWISVDPRQAWSGEPNFGIERITTLAIPLVSVKTAEHLKEKVIEPLKEGVQEACARESG